MRHSMDFDDTYYYVDVVDNFVSEYVHDTFIKDKHSKILEDESLEADAPDDLVDEVYCQELVVARVPLIQE